MIERRLTFYSTCLFGLQISSINMAVKRDLISSTKHFLFEYIVKLAINEHLSWTWVVRPEKNHQMSIKVDQK